jgi:hypothetical protein
MMKIMINGSDVWHATYDHLFISLEDAEYISSESTQLSQNSSSSPEMLFRISSKLWLVES